MTPYVTICTIHGAADDLVIPVLSVHADAAAARSNAVLVLAQLADAIPDDTATVTIAPVAMSDAGVREFLDNLRQHRPDLLRTKRGKQP